MSDIQNDAWIQKQLEEYTKLLQYSNKIEEELEKSKSWNKRLMQRIDELKNQIEREKEVYLIENNLLKEIIRNHTDIEDYYSLDELLIHWYNAYRKGKIKKKG